MASSYVNSLLLHYIIYEPISEMCGRQVVNRKSVKWLSVLKLVPAIPIHVQISSSNKLIVVVVYKAMKFQQAFLT